MTALRLRLTAGAVALASLAILAAFLAAFGIRQAVRLSEETSFAQSFIDAYGTLSARVSDLILAPPQARENAASAVRHAIERLHDLSAADIERAEVVADSDNRALRGQALSRLQGSVDMLLRDLPAVDDPTMREAVINNFAAQFSPLIGREIELQRLRRTSAIAELRALHDRLLILAIAVAVASPLLLAALHFWLIRPLIERLRAAADLARLYDPARPEVQKLPVERHDELGLLFARFNLMIARLDRGRRRLEEDRNHLEAVVTERTAELRAANVRLERIDHDRRRFFADVGHELRTPMTVILAEAELGLTHAALPEVDAREAFAIIAARARRLSRRIDDLLRVARSESGQLEFATRDFDPGTAARAAMDDVAPLARKARIEVILHLTEGLRLHADEDWIRQVLAGLLENAIRHSPPGATVEVSVERRDGCLTLAVTDEGKGVPESDCCRVFERHVRGKEEQEPGGRATGFGVGLALARWVVTRQGGEIVLQSPVGRPGARGPGTRVQLRFPEALAS
jgi:signal transduction histidine kinase